MAIFRIVYNHTQQKTMVSTNRSKIMRHLSAPVKRGNGISRRRIIVLVALLLAIPVIVQSKKGEAAKKAAIEREQSQVELCRA